MSKETGSCCFARCSAKRAKANNAINADVQKRRFALLLHAVMAGVRPRCV
jgi:hypothetical protein